MLRERGHSVEAQRLETQELPGLLDALSPVAESTEAIAARVAEIFAAETERVANAAVLAELLAPLLRETVLTDRVSAVVNTVPEVAAIETLPVPARPRPSNIADFIDDMIAQERPTDRTNRGTRRAS